MAGISFKDNVAFYGHQKGLPTHRLAVEGKKFWNKILERDKDFGGWAILILGLMGSGKTSLMLEMADQIIKKYPDELLFWREPILTPMQCCKFGDRFELFVERGMKLKVFELGERKPITTDRYPIRYFHGYSELLNMVRPGQLNVVYFKENYKWLELLLRLRFSTQFQTCFLDELEDITPSISSGSAFKSIGRFANSFKEIRKGRTNIFANTQQGSDLDWRLRKKFMMTIYLPGSRTEQESPIYNATVGKLEVGEGLIDFAHSLYGKICFPAHKPKHRLYTVFPVDAGGRLSYISSYTPPLTTN